MHELIYAYECSLTDFLLSETLYSAQRLLFHNLGQVTTSTSYMIISCVENKRWYTQCYNWQRIGNHALVKESTSYVSDFMENVIVLISIFSAPGDTQGKSISFNYHRGLQRLVLAGKLNDSTCQRIKPKFFT